MFALGLCQSFKFILDSSGFREMKVEQILTNELLRTSNLGRNPV